MSVTELVVASYQCEPPIRVQEKEQYRKLMHQLSGFPTMISCNNTSSTAENEIMTVTTLEPI